MQLLKSLKLVHYEHPTHRNPRLHRLHKLLAKLAEQLELARNSSYQPTKTQFVADAEGNMQTETLNGMAARAFQHELDHLNGVNYLDKAKKIHLDQARRKQKLIDRKLKRMRLA